MNSRAQLYVLFFYMLLAGVLSANEISPPKEAEFTILDKICVEIEGEPPVLLSEIEKRAAQENMSFNEATKELTRERVLWIYAKKQLKYDTNQIFKAAEDHVKKVMENLKIDKQKFADLLMAAPYLTTINQFKRDTSGAILKNQVIAGLANEVVITNELVQEEITKINKALVTDFDVVFISVVPRDNKGKKSALTETAQFSKAHEIKSKIKANTSLDDIRKLYEGHANIVIEPFTHEKSTLAKNYKQALEKSGNNPVTQPFKDDGSVTLIWKIKKAKKILDKTDIEKVRKELYDRAVVEKYNSITDPMMNSSTVVAKDCSNR